MTPWLWLARHSLADTHSPTLTRRHSLAATLTRTTLTRRHSLANKNNLKTLNALRQHASNQSFRIFNLIGSLRSRKSNKNSKVASQHRLRVSVRKWLSCEWLSCESQSCYENWQDPEMLELAEQEYNATKFGSQCLQWNQNGSGGATGDENCLFLNVFTKILPGNRLN